MAMCARLYVICARKSLNIELICFLCLVSCEWVTVEIFFYSVVLMIRDESDRLQIQFCFSWRTGLRLWKSGKRILYICLGVYSLLFISLKLFSFCISTVEAYRKQVNLEGPAIIGIATGDKAPATYDKQKSSQSSSHSMDAGTAAGITFGVTALAGLLIAVMVIGWRRHKSVKRQSSDLREPLNSLGNYGAVHDEGSPRVWFSTKSGYIVPFSPLPKTLIIKQRNTRQAWK